MKKTIQTLMLSVLGLAPLGAFATGSVQIANPFLDPIGVSYMICNAYGRCDHNMVALIGGHGRFTLKMDRYDSITLLHVNAFEAQYDVKTYDGSSCKIDMGGVDNMQGTINFYQPEHGYDTQLLCVVSVESPPHPLIQK